MKLMHPEGIPMQTQQENEHAFVSFRFPGVGLPVPDCLRVFTGEFVFKVPSGI
jgi:hypothetical protein